MSERIATTDSAASEPLAEHVQQPPTPASRPVPSHYDNRSDGTTGFFTLLGLLLLFGSFCWWKSYSPMHPYQRFHVRFHDVAGMNTQAAVFVNGVRVGAVEKINVVDRSTVDVGIRVSTAKINIPEGSEFVILPNGVVGAKYVEILLPPAAKQQKLLTANSITWGEDPVRPEIVVNELCEKLSTIDFDAMQQKLSRGMDRMSFAADHISRLSQKMEPVADHTVKTEENVSNLAKSLQEPVQQMHQIMDQKHPLLHMIFGRPGHVKKSKKTEEVVSDDGAKVEKKAQTEVSTDGDTTKVETKKMKHHKSQDADQ